MRAYPAALIPDSEGGFTVTFRDVPEAITEGDTREEALLRAEDALESALAMYVAAKESLPARSEPMAGEALVPLSALGMAKTALYEAMREQGVGRAELARRLRWHLPQIHRVLDLCHASRMEQVEAALAALGLRLVVDVARAAQPWIRVPGQTSSARAGEFIRRIEALGAARGVPVRFDRTHGKGSHGTLYYGERLTVVKDRRKECGPGQIAKMLADLGLTRIDLRQIDMEWRFEYPAKVVRDEAGFYLVTFPDFPEAATDCRQHEKIRIEATDCPEEAIAGRIKRGDDLPTPSRAEPRMLTVALRALYAMKAALYLAVKEARLSPAALAAKLGTNEKGIERLLNPRRMRPAELEAALRAIGKSVRVVVEDAAAP